MTLYRKYRPTTFSQITGQDNIKSILTEELKSGHIAHAYLFSGPRGTGKTSMARIFAKALNCQKLDKKSGESCDKCDMCKDFIEAKMQDLIEVDAASNRRIEDIRELRENIKYSPSKAEYKVYIIDEVHMLTGESFNALLKTLEEPPKHAIFILATTELHKIPETIFSRCQHFNFKKLSLTETLERLKMIVSEEKVKVDEDVLKEIARKSGGALRDAESLLGQILAIGKKSITVDDATLFLPKVGFTKILDWLEFLSKKNAQSALETVSQLDEEGANLEFFLEQTLETARQAMLFKVTDSSQYLELNFSPQETAKIKEIASQTDVVHLRKIVVELLRASQDMSLSPEIPTLPIELAVIIICEDENRPPLVGKPIQTFSKESASLQSANLAEEANFSKESRINNSTRLNDSQSNKQSEVAISQEPQFNGSKDVEPLKQEQKKDFSGSKHSLEEILDGWGEVLTKVKNKSQALNFILGVAEPIGVKEGIVELAFKYRLQQEKVVEHSNRQVLEEIIEEVYGAPYRLEPSLKEDMEIASASADKNKDELADAESGDNVSDEEILIKTAMEVFDGAVLESK